MQEGAFNREASAPEDMARRVGTANCRPEGRNPRIGQAQESRIARVAIDSPVGTSIPSLRTLFLFRDHMPFVGVLSGCPGFQFHELTEKRESCLSVMGRAERQPHGTVLIFWRAPSARRFQF